MNLSQLEDVRIVGVIRSDVLDVVIKLLFMEVTPAEHRLRIDSDSDVTTIRVLAPGMELFHSQGLAGEPKGRCRVLSDRSSWGHVSG